MNSKTKLFVFSLLFIAGISHAQEGYEMRPNEKYTEIDFLSGYYTQDGNNAAVTGGIGTEALTDVSNIIVINMPLDSTKSVNASFGADYYTSASTDNIDNNPSSASSKDVRAYANLGFNIKNLKQAFTYGVKLGFSSEFDYTSVSGGINLAKEFNNGNTEFSFNALAFIDSWALYFPRELRNEVSVPTKSRKSYNGQLTWSQVINKRMQMSISAEVVYMEGLLSTPFHRVYFADNSNHDIERLPSSRLKIPLAVRLNYKPMDRLSVRTYYRYYTDDFGIDGHTASIELPYEINDSWAVSPFYRFHTQTASDYFAPFEEHLSSETFYTSDYDLSELNSSKYGVEFSYAPLYGIGRISLPNTKKVIRFHEINLRLARYTRDTGLDAFNVSLQLNLRI